MLRRAALVAFSLLCTTTLLAARDETSVRKWREDLSFLKQQIQATHPDPWSHISEAEFQKKLDAISTALPQLTDDQLTVRLMELMASFGPRDGHTMLNPMQPALRPAPVPLFFYSFSDGIFLKTAPESMKDAVGAKLVLVDGVPANGALAQAMSITAGDNDMSKRAWAPLVFSLPNLLQGLGVAKSSKPEYLLRKRDGSEIRLKPEPLMGPPDNLKFVDAREMAGSSTPLYLRHASRNPMDPEAPEKNYWFEYLPES